MKVVRCLSSVVSQNVDLKTPHRVEYKVFNLGQIEQLVEKYGLKEFSMENLIYEWIDQQN